MKNTIPSASRQAGFTVVELAVSIVVFGIASIGIFTLFTSLQETQRRTANLQSANRAAQQEVESLRNNNYNTLTPGQVIDFTSQLPASLPSPKSGTVNVSQPSAGLRRIDVTVSYRDRGATKQVKLSSLIGIIGISK